jgi:hypothetical protein
VFAPSGLLFRVFSVFRDSIRWTLEGAAPYMQWPKNARQQMALATAGTACSRGETAWPWA